jgi:hypothetical protein
MNQLHMVLGSLAAVLATAACGSYQAASTPVITTETAVAVLATDTPLPASTSSPAPEPTATETVPPEPTTAPPSATPEPVQTPPGLHFSGGQTITFGRLSIQLPDAGEFIIGGGVGDPGGTFIAIYSVATDSTLFISPDDGHELERHSVQPAANAIFDAIVNAIRVTQ